MLNFFWYIRLSFQVFNLESQDNNLEMNVDEDLLKDTLWMPVEDLSVEHVVSECVWMHSRNRVFHPLCLLWSCEPHPTRNTLTWLRVSTSTLLHNLTNVPIKVFVEGCADVEEGMMSLNRIRHDLIVQKESDERNESSESKSPSIEPSELGSEMSLTTEERYIYVESGASVSVSLNLLQTKPEYLGLIIKPDLPQKSEWSDAKMVPIYYGKQTNQESEFILVPCLLSQLSCQWHVLINYSRTHKGDLSHISFAPPYTLNNLLPVPFLIPNYETVGSEEGTVVYPGTSSSIYLWNDDTFSDVISTTSQSTQGIKPKRKSSLISRAIRRNRTSSKMRKNEENARNETEAEDRLPSLIISLMSSNKREGKNYIDIEVLIIMIFPCHLYIYILM